MTNENQELKKKLEEVQKKLYSAQVMSTSIVLNMLSRHEQSEFMLLAHKAKKLEREFLKQIIQEYLAYQKSLKFSEEMKSLTAIKPPPEEEWTKVQ